MTSMIKNTMLIIFMLSLIACNKSEQIPNKVDDASEQYSWIDFDEYSKNNYDQPIFIQFTADWCANCLWIEDELLNTSTFAKYVTENNMIAVKAIMTEETDSQIRKWFKENLNTDYRAPTYVVIKNNKIVNVFNEEFIDIFKTR